MCIGGHFDHSEEVTYVGGCKCYFEGVDMDRFWFDDLYELYKKCGGRKTNVNFYYNLQISKMMEAYRGVGVPINIYVIEEVDDPLMAMDLEGNILPNEINVQERNDESMQLVPYEEEKMNKLLSGINFDDEFEAVRTQHFTQFSATVGVDKEYSSKEKEKEKAPIVEEEAKNESNAPVVDNRKKPRDERLRPTSYANKGKGKAVLEDEDEISRREVK
ncbi:hypothetical protein CDL12_14383 [Handroanthus impetiginosus]|uniref:Uncharacterized protein n=1 Tax=Handroanthus impetiginosus TaxID=429701 RepID=A0A2G9H659_9LAMI|nr:hypothetical protein CDL12_14383 [Handroanthus impetiginosus]